MPVDNSMMVSLPFFSLHHPLRLMVLAFYISLHNQPRWRIAIDDWNSGCFPRHVVSALYRWRNRIPWCESAQIWNIWVIWRVLELVVLYSFIRFNHTYFMCGVYQKFHEMSTWNTDQPHKKNYIEIIIWDHVSFQTIFIRSNPLPSVSHHQCFPPQEVGGKSTQIFDLWNWPWLYWIQGPSVIHGFRWKTVCQNGRWVKNTLQRSRMTPWLHDCWNFRVFVFFLLEPKV